MLSLNLLCVCDMIINREKIYERVVYATSFSVCRNEYD